MLRTLLIFIFFLIVFAGIVLYLMQAPGFASFNYGDLTIELPLVRFAIGLFIVFVVFYLLLRIISQFFSAPRRIQAAALRRKQHKAINDTKEGLTKFILGDWTQSEKLLLRGADNIDTACINYIWAARAAHRAGEYETRDRHLGMAKKCTPEAHAALNVLQAEHLLDQGLPERALANLNQQNNEIRSNSKIANLFVNAYVQLNDWQKLAEIIPDLKKTKGLDKQALTKIQKQTAQGLLRNCKDKGNSEKVENIGSQFKDVIFANSELAVTYIELLRAQGKHQTAETLIANALDSKWDTELVHQYGLLQLDDPSHALNKAEQWAQQHDDDANLFLTLGRFCKRAQLWGKAKSYFESSLSRKPLAETYAELAVLHEHLNELDDAHICTKKGLKLATQTI